MQKRIPNGSTRSTAGTIEFDWRLIPSFLAALERGSLLGAARALGTTQPTVGRHVAELESQLGSTLFERTGRGLVPTPLALRLADAARAMDSGADALARAATGMDDTLAGTVRISASQSVAVHLLPPVLSRMREALPSVRTVVIASNAVTNLLRREADIAVRMVEPKQASLVIRRIGRVRIGACAHRDYLRRRGVPRVPADLLAHDLVGWGGDDSMLRGLAAAGVSLARDEIAFWSDDMSVCWEAVRAGLGIGFVAEHVARHDRDVLPVLATFPIPALPVWLAVHREIRTNARIRAVYDVLAREIAAAL